ncbi:hypothetical protein [Desulfoscipio gibsoniae]|uniref:Uncharacterized protein n=1 Tax=Desulfoscipio gibsoniae DSM 7213 TaxID=767817 RepID=R4KA38_9FIRM|nr:hypothetical protein [Desulfoscipio gibsoniae]AGL00018.1 hypothetical protein Desgi_0443 [Desulfoscipio gibsoniae DSM 7213]
MNISVGKNAPGEGYFTGSVISGQSFKVTITNSGYTGSVTIYANSASSDTGYQLGSIYVQNGTGTGYFTIRSVLGLTDSSRKLTAIDNKQNRASIVVGVWFQVTMTVECLNPDYNNVTLYCGQKYTTKQKFASLPYGDRSRLCNHPVAIYATRTHQLATVPIQDAGPKTTTDNYWNKTGVPQYPDRGIDGSDGTWDALGLSSYYQCSSPAYGSETVQWRFT